MSVLSKELIIVHCRIVVVSLSDESGVNDDSDNYDDGDDSGDDDDDGAEDSSSDGKS